MAATKPTAVHFSLVFFALTTLILAIVCYSVGKEYTAAAAQAKTATEETSSTRAALTSALSDVEALKARTGYQQESVVGGDASVDAAMMKDLVGYGREQVQPSESNPTVAGTLQSLRSALDTSMAQVETLQGELKAAEDRLAQERTQHRNRSDQLQTTQEGSEAQLQKLVTERDELLAEKDREISKWRDEYRRELVEKEQLRDELDRVRKDLTNQLAELENVVDYLRDRLNNAENLSFEVADGEIIRVDNTTRKVWINLGKQHNLRSQIGFSVYTKNHRGVGRGAEDIKAKIEVTKVLDQKLAEANILDEDPSRPIQGGDPIYSPLWTPGMKETFSFVGVVDLDGDGKSDRQLLHDILENAGASVEVEITDEGERAPVDGELTVASKFLVIGEIEDQTQFSGFTDKQQQIQKVMDEHGNLLKDARRQGIRVVPFGDFLNYMGYKPQERLYLPGESLN